MLSWRTKEENLLCLKYFGKISFENLSLFLTIKQFPSSVHSTISQCFLSWSYSKTDLEDFVGFHDEVGYFQLPMSSFLGEMRLTIFSIGLDIFLFGIDLVLTVVEAIVITRLLIVFLLNFDAIMLWLWHLYMKINGWQSIIKGLNKKNKQISSGHLAINSLTSLNLVMWLNILLPMISYMCTNKFTTCGINSALYSSINLFNNGNTCLNNNCFFYLYIALIIPSSLFTKAILDLGRAYRIAWHRWGRIWGISIYSIKTVVHFSAISFTSILLLLKQLNIVLVKTFKLF